MAGLKMLALCLFVCVNCIIQISATIEVKATCTGNLVVYADNVEKGTHSSKTTAKTLSIPDVTKVVGIKCSGVDRGTTAIAGMLASFKMEYAGDYITDATWRCSAEFKSGWAQNTFDDSTWIYASSPGNNDNSVPSGLSKISGIAAHSKWIWTSKSNTQNGDLTVYCRGRIAMERRMDNYGRKFAIGFVDNHVVSGSEKGIKLLITTLKPTDVTVYCFTPHISAGTNHLSEVRSISAGTIQSIKPALTLRNDGTSVTNGDKSILCIATDAVKIIGENQEKHSSDLFMTFPVDSLGTATDSVVYYAVSWDKTDTGYDQRLLLVAAYDNTKIDITPKGAGFIYGGATKTAGTKFSITLQKYRTVQMGGGKSGLEADMTGTKVVADKPITVYSGNKKTSVKGTDANSASADHLIEQLVPVSTWGKTYAITPLPIGGNYRQEKHIAWYKIVAAEDGTKITIKPYLGTTAQTVIEKTLNAGDSYKYAHGKKRSAYLTSNKGVMVAQFATTKQSGECTGDPWLQIIPPIYEYERDYSITPPSLSEKSGCTNFNFFTIIVKTAEKDSVTIDGELIGSITNNNIKTLGYNTIPGTDYSYQTVQIPLGFRRIAHKKPTVSFGLYYFGYGSLDSYASMGGSRMAPINEACAPTQSKLGDGIDNDCDGQIDEDLCSQPDPAKDCAPPSPINGGWASWAVDGICQCASGTTGTKPYTRSCSNPVPQYNGVTCSGDSTKSEACSCTPVDGGWSDWSSYDQCSKTCGPGSKQRSRTCTNPLVAYGGKDCSGSRTETASCTITPCPINGGWTAYQNSGQCVCASGTYSGQQQQTRSCTNPTPQHGGTNCTGSTSKTVACNCPRDGVWTSWGAWGTCSVSCSAGQWSRSRTCTNPAPAYGGKNCTGDDSGTASCNLGPCPIDGGWSSWDTSATCTCGSSTQGQRTDTRSCTNPAPQHGGAQCDTSVNGVTKVEACDCTQALPSISDYNVEHNKTITGTKTSTPKTLEECHSACTSDNKCVGYVYRSDSSVNDKCESFVAANSKVEVVDSPQGGIVVVKKSALTTTPIPTTVAADGSLNANGAGAQGADPNAANSQAQGGSDNTVPIAGALGGAAVAGIAGAGIIAAVRRRKKKKEEEEKEPNKGTETNDAEVEDLEDADAADFDV